MRFSTSTCFNNNSARFQLKNERADKTFHKPPEVMLTTGLPPITASEDGWIDSMNTYMMRTLPIDINGITTFRSKYYANVRADSQPVKMWLNAVLKQEVSLSELKKIFDIGGVKDVELRTNGEDSIQINVIFGLDTETPLQTLLEKQLLPKNKVDVLQRKQKVLDRSGDEPSFNKSANPIIKSEHGAKKRKQNHPQNNVHHQPRQKQWRTSNDSSDSSSDEYSDILE